jgi:hypothetical protein
MLEYTNPKMMNMYDSYESLSKSKIFQNEFPHFKSQLETYQLPSPFASNIRYSLSKKKIDVPNLPYS